VVLATELDEALGCGAELLLEGELGAGSPLALVEGATPGVSTITGAAVSFATGAAN
jgi:hypothetical protein